MARKAWIAIALVVWLIVLAFRGVSVSALPNHVVAGGVLGPGGDISPGAGNAANAAGMVFYSTSQPSYTLLTGADSYTPASGTQPALWAKDVGASWNWAAGDVMVAVVETVRGVNGWTSVNSTTSIDGILMAGATVQDVGNGTLETFPTITAVGSTTYVFSSWPRLADANGNIVSYSLYRTPGPGSPITTAPQAATMSYNDTGLAAGTYCYTVQVNYRRDLTTGIYGTTGRSERACRTLSGVAANTPPTAALTAPGVCATGTAFDAAVVITFIEAMNRTATQGAISCSPAVTGLTFAWSVGDTVVTVGHAALAANTQYTLTVSTAAKDACSPGTPIASAYTATFKTAPASGSTNGPLPIDPLWIIIAIIVVALVIVGLLLMRRRKPTPAPGVGMPSESPPEAPMDESSPPDESLAPPTDM